MPFGYNEELGCKVYDPPLTGFDLKYTYFSVREECKDSLIYLHGREIESNERRIFNWVALVTVADWIGQPIRTTCEFLEKWGKVRSGLFESKGLTSKQIRQEVEKYKKRVAT